MCRSWSGRGFAASSCSFADSLAVRASIAGPNKRARSAALFFFLVDARSPFAIVNTEIRPTLRPLVTSLLVKLVVARSG